MYLYESAIELEEIGILDGVELLLSHYRYGLNGENGCALVDSDGMLVAKINVVGDVRYNNLVLKTGGVWQNNHHYSIFGDFGKPLKVKKIKNDGIQKCVQGSNGSARQTGKGGKNGRI